METPTKANIRIRYTEEDNFDSPFSITNISPALKHKNPDLGGLKPSQSISIKLNFNEEGETISLDETNNSTNVEAKVSITSTSSTIQNEDNNLITGGFSREELDNKFGQGFSSKGMVKKGFRTQEIYEGSVAVQDGRVLLKKNGEVDKRCKAVRDGSIVFKEDGMLDITNSSLFQNKEVRTNSQDACHIVSFEILNKVSELNNLSFTREDAEKTVRSLNKDDNLQLKSTSGNFSGTYYMDGLGDRSLDAEILKAFSDGKNLSAAASKRAKQQIDIILNSKGQLPDEVIQSLRVSYSNLRDHNGLKICRVNAKISSVKEGESRRNIEYEPSRSETGLKNDGEPDLRTTIAKLRAALEQQQQQQQLNSPPTPPPQAPFSNLPRTETGLKNNGEPDLRTNVGKKLAAQQQQQQLNSLPPSPPQAPFMSSVNISISSKSHSTYTSSYVPTSNSHSTRKFSGTSTGTYHSSRGSANGRELFTGPRGGTYYVNSKGNKTYV